MSMAPVYALNLFDLAPNDDYLAYQRNISKSLKDYGSKVVALGTLSPAADQADGDTPPRQVMILVEWTSRAAFDAFLADPAQAGQHGLRENGTERYLWWLYDRIDDLRPIFQARAKDGGEHRTGGA
jgi:hypothetical protein